MGSIFNVRSLSRFDFPILTEATKKQYQWHSLSHRKVPFYDLAVTLFLNNPSLHSEFEVLIVIWERKLKTIDPDSDDYIFLYGLIQRFKPENYTTTESMARVIGSLMNLKNFSVCSKRGK